MWLHPPSYIEKLEIEFNNKDLCIICYAQDLAKNSYRLPCGHSFCKDCIQHYLENLINDSKVENIKCLQAGCKNTIQENIIKELVKAEDYFKYIKFYKRAITLENLKKGFKH